MSDSRGVSFGTFRGLGRLGLFSALLLAAGCETGERSLRADLVALTTGTRAALPRFVGDFAHARCAPRSAETLVTGILCSEPLAASEDAMRLQFDLTSLMSSRWPQLSMAVVSAVASASVKSLQYPAIRKADI